MALTSQQIVTLACQDARGIGYTSQAGEFLNMILGDLCQTYDFEIAAGTFYGNFNPGLQALMGNSIYGSGPYPLPGDFLRFKDDKSAFWTLLGVPYFMIPCDLSEFDMLVQQAGTQSYPYIIATDMSESDLVQQGIAGSNGAFYVYSPPSGTYPYTGRYQKQMPDIATPETSSTIPWFPNQGYLRRKLAAAVMGLTNDDRQPTWEQQADAMLTSYLKLKDNRSNRAQTVKLDRRRFGTPFSNLPVTKVVGWAMVIGLLLSGMVMMHGWTGGLHADGRGTASAERV